MEAPWSSSRPNLGQTIQEPIAQPCGTRSARPSLQQHEDLQGFLASAAVETEHASSLHTGMGAGNEWAAYGAQLREWVELQVDDYLRQALPTLLEASTLAENLVEVKRQTLTNQSFVERIARQTAELQKDMGQLRGRAQAPEHGIVQRLELDFAQVHAKLSDSDTAIVALADQVAALAAEATKAPSLQQGKKLPDVESFTSQLRQLETNSYKGMDQLQKQLSAMELEVERLSSELLQLKGQVQELQLQRIGNWEPHFDGLSSDLLQLREELQASKKGLKDEEGGRPDLAELARLVKQELEELRAKVEKEQRASQLSLLTQVRKELAEAFRTEATVLSTLEQRVTQGVQDALQCSSKSEALQGLQGLRGPLRSSFRS